MTVRREIFRPNREVGIFLLTFCPFNPNSEFVSNKPVKASQQKSASKLERSVSGIFRRNEHNVRMICDHFLCHKDMHFEIGDFSCQKLSKILN
jgi:hypothetical protein